MCIKGWEKIVLFGMICFVTTLWPTAKAQAPDRPANATGVQPAKAEIVSLHLYMTAQEAIAALKERFHVSLSECRPVSGSDASCVRTKPTTWTPGKKFVQDIHYQTEQFWVTGQFIESYPFDPLRPEILTSISYGASWRTPADLEVLEQQIFEKYGPPTNKSGPKSGPQMAEWCTVRSWAGTCSYDGPFLSLNRGQLSLQDTTVIRKEQEQWMRQRTTTTRPPL